MFRSVTIKEKQPKGDLARSKYHYMNLLLFRWLPTYAGHCSHRIQVDI